MLTISSEANAMRANTAVSLDSFFGVATASLSSLKQVVTSRKDYSLSMTNIVSIAVAKSADRSIRSLF